MNKNAYQELISKLGTLTPEQRTDVRLRLQAYHDTTPVESTAKEDDWVFTGLCAAFKAKGLLSAASIPALLRSGGYKTYRQVSGVLRQDLERLLPVASRTTTGRVSLSYLAGTALIEWVRKHRKIPMRAAACLENSPFLMEALEEAFPGYIEANMFHVVLSRSLQRTP